MRGERGGDPSNRGMISKCGEVIPLYRLCNISNWALEVNLDFLQDVAFFFLEHKQNVGCFFRAFFKSFFKSPQVVFICSKSTEETLEQSAKYVQSWE